MSSLLTLTSPFTYTFVSYAYTSFPYAADFTCGKVCFPCLQPVPVCKHASLAHELDGLYLCYPALRTSVTLIPACGVNAPRCCNPAYVFFFIPLFFCRTKKSGKNTLNTQQYGNPCCRVFNVPLSSVMCVYLKYTTHDSLLFRVIHKHIIRV